MGDEAVFGQIASALSRMADAAERGGTAAAIPAYAAAEECEDYLPPLHLNHPFEYRVTVNGQL